MSLVEDLSGVVHFFVGSTNRDEVGEDLVGLVEVVAEEMGVYLRHLVSGFQAMKKPQNLAFSFEGTSVHCSRQGYSRRKKRVMEGNSVGITRINYLIYKSHELISQICA